MIERYVLGLEKIDKTQVALVGGKGAHLGSFRGSKAFACRLAFA
jgi:phosphoenolpyruvate synthase/pyruvate phosphate dikinase